jgi:hypothetical protein
MKKYKNGDDLGDALKNKDLRVGEYIIYHGYIHEVIDAGDQGLRVKALKRINEDNTDEEYDCPLHGKVGHGGDCPRC